MIRKKTYTFFLRDIKSIFKAKQMALTIRKIGVGAGESAQLLSMSAVFPEYLGSIPSTYTAHNHL